MEVMVMVEKGEESLLMVLTARGYGLARLDLSECDS